MGVHRALATAGLYFAGVAPLVQFAVFHDSTQGYPYRGLIWASFAVHAVVWSCAVLRWLPVVAVLSSWAAIGVMIAVQAASVGVAEPAAPRNIALTIAATAALLLPLRRAVAATVAVSLASAAALVLAARQPTLPRDDRYRVPGARGPHSRSLIHGTTDAVRTHRRLRTPRISGGRSVGRGGTAA